MTSFKMQDSLAEQIAQYLSQRIFTSELKSGERVQEMRIANELNVSRGSVREAFLLLQQRHLIDIIPRKGALVADLPPKLLQDLFDMHEMILLQSITWLCQSGRDDDVKPLVQLLDIMEGYITTGQIPHFYAAIVNFSEVCVQAVNNFYLSSSLANLLPVVQRALHQVSHMNPSDMVELYRALKNVVDNMIARDSSAAEQQFVKYNEYLQRIISVEMRATDTLEPG